MSAEAIPISRSLVVSVVVPVHNEAENLPGLAEEIAAAMQDQEFEVIFVNDGSSDDTEDVLYMLRVTRPWLRQIKHTQSCGQSAAILSGVRASRSSIVVTLDGDGQNDPSFLPKLIDVLQSSPDVGLVNGRRLKRKGGFKKIQSWVANNVRATILGDGTLDTGCGLKAFHRDLYLSLPFFDALHRFTPALVQREGYEVKYLDVVDRPRQHGHSHYGLWGRMCIGIVDLCGVAWLISRRRHIPKVTEIAPDVR